MKQFYHRHPDLLLASLLFSLSLLPMIICLATGRTLVLDDAENLAEWWPYRIFVNQAIKEQFLPLWCPGLLAGFPFLAWSHSSALSPAGIVYFLLPYDKAAVMSLTLHLLIYNFGLYYLLRGLKIRPFPALLAVIQTGFGFFLLIEQNHFLPKLLTLSLVPLGYALLYRLFLRPRLHYLFGFMAVCLFEALGGQLEIFGRSMVLAVLVIVLYGVFLRPAPRLALSRLALFAGAVTSAALLILVQVLPTLELIAFSTRGVRYPLYLFTQSSLKVNQDLLILLLFFNPLIIVSVLFAFVLVRKDPQVLVLVVAFALCLAVSTNTLGCLRLVHLIPVLNRLLWHAYMMVIGTIFLAVLAGKAMDHLLSEASSAQGFLFLLLALAMSWTANRDVYLALNGLAVAMISITAAFHYFAQRKQRRIGARLNPAILALVTGAFYLSCLAQLRLGGAEFMKHDPSYVKSVQSLPVGLRSLNLTNHTYFHSLSIPYQAGIYYNTQSFDFFISVIPRWTYDFLSLIKPFWRLEDFRLHRSMQLFDIFKHGDFIKIENLKFLNFLNLGLIATDHENFKFAEDYHLLYFTKWDDCSPAPCLIRDAAASPYRRTDLVLPANGAWRHPLFVEKGDRFQFHIGRERGTAAMIFTLQARRPSDPKEFLIFQKEMVEGGKFQKYELDLSAWAGQALELQFEVRANDPEEKESSLGVWLDPTIYHQNFVFEKLAESGDVGLYRNRQVLPRAFLLHQVHIIPEREARLSFMASAEFDPARLVVLEKPLDFIPSPLPPGAEEGVQIVDYQPNRVSLLARVSAPAILVISDTYFPGWRAFGRGREIRLLRANHAFRGLALSPGTHYVEMIYQPRSFRIGLWTSLVSILIMIVVSKTRILCRIKTKKQAGGCCRPKQALPCS